MKKQTALIIAASLAAGALAIAEQATSGSSQSAPKQEESKKAPPPVVPPVPMPLVPIYRPPQKTPTPAAPTHKTPNAPAPTKKTTPPAKATAKPAPKSGSSAAVQVPKDATQIDAYTWRSVDAKGTAWIYRKTPFGLNYYREDEKPTGVGAGPLSATDAGVPRDAKQLDATSWRWVDPQGTAWIYRKTPFGTNKYREKDIEEPSRQQAETNPARVTDLGDRYKFERSTPFGVQRWERKKDELSDSEKDMLKVAQEQAASAKAQD